MRMEFTEHITDGACGFFVLGCSVEPELTHCIDDSSLHRLQAVAYVRECAIENNVHRIIEIRFLSKRLERYALDAFEVKFVLTSHRIILGPISIAQCVTLSNTTQTYRLVGNLSSSKIPLPRGRGDKESGRTENTKQKPPSHLAGGGGVRGSEYHTCPSARLPFFSSHSLRSLARFFASSISSICSA